jgi:hypothetical protein
LARDLNQNIKDFIKEELKLPLTDDDNVNIASDSEYYGQLYKKNHVVARRITNRKLFYTILHIVIHNISLNKHLFLK